MIVFGCFTDYSLLNGRRSTSYIFYELFFSGVLRTKIKTSLIVFEITKTKTLKFTVKFDLKLGGKKRTEDNRDNFTD